MLFRFRASVTAFAGGLLIAWLGLRTSAVMAGDSSAVTAYEAVVRGGGEFALYYAGSKSASADGIRIRLPTRGSFKGGVQHDEERYITYAQRLALASSPELLPPYVAYSNCVAAVQLVADGVNSGSELLRFLYPHFHEGRGCYDHENVTRLMPEWTRDLALFPTREYGFRLVPDAANARTLVYLDGSLMACLPGVRTVAKVGRTREGGTIEVISQGAVKMRFSPSREELPSLPGRAHGALAAGALLSVAVGATEVAGVPMTVWTPAESLDLGRHRATTANRDLSWNPLMERTPWSVGAEYMQWSVRAERWRYAWVLCAEISEAGRRACVGTQLAKFGSGCSAGSVDLSRTYLDDPPDDPRVAIREVGTLTYADAQTGETLQTPLYLVRHPLDVSVLGSRAEGQLALDFEFVGCGTAGTNPRSSVQVFGCTLEAAPFAFSVANDVRGNIFELDGSKRAAGFDLAATRDGARGHCEYRIYDPAFATLEEGRIDFALGAAGERRHFELDLEKWGVGWYGLDLVFFDEEGVEVTRHEASFAVLAPDDREAGYDSPYACWPQPDGAHNSNPDDAEILEVMRKAGYRKTWHPPCGSEDDAAALGHRVTLSSVGLGFMKPGEPVASEAEMAARLDAAVAEYRELFAKFPHCEVIQLLHEQGGREIAKELTGALTPQKGVYRGFCQPWEDTYDYVAYFCTEYARRMRREFPGKKIMLGNGSSSSELVAVLVRHGFDLSLVDQLGIESKGFSSLPELNANLESPGMLWALRETGRVFGGDHLAVNACNEFVFRPERRLARTAPLRTVMRMTDYALRDCLLALGHGCSTISVGHLEDCNDAYYETNWGAGGQCAFYPFSYPKRMYAALATLTRALDCPQFLRRLPTGELTAYALEFRRNRRTPDYAYALWTPRYGATLAVRFPSGADVRLRGTFGAETVLAPAEDGEVRVEIGSSPCYLIASQAAEDARVVAHAAPEVPSGTSFATGRSLGLADFSFGAKPGGDWANAYGIPPPAAGAFAAAEVADEELRRLTGVPSALELTLRREGELPDVIWEHAQLDLAVPVGFKLSETGRIGIYVRGNGSFSQVQLLVKPKKGTAAAWCLKPGTDGGYVDFDGWQLLTAALPASAPDRFGGRDDLQVSAVVCGSARRALDPIEMTDVTANLRLGPIVVAPRTEGEDIVTDHVHTWGEWKIESPPTCTQMGLHSRVCIGAGCTEPPAEEREETEPLGHDWAGWTVDRMPTADEPGHKYRECLRCRETEERVLAPIAEPDPAAYGDPDEAAVTYAWRGGEFGFWATAANWEPSARPAYGVPAVTLATALVPADGPDVGIDLGGGSWTVGSLICELTGDVKLTHGQLNVAKDNYGSKGFSMQTNAVNVIADGNDAAVTYRTFSFVSDDSSLMAVNGATVGVTYLMNVKKGTSGARLRAIGAGSLLSVAGTSPNTRLNAVGTTFEARDGGAIKYAANRTFEDDAAGYPHDLGTRLVAENGTIRIANKAKVFCFGTYGTDATCFDTCIRVAGANGLLDVDGAMTLGSEAVLTSPLAVELAVPRDGFAAGAAMLASGVAAVGANVRLRVDASACPAPSDGETATYRLLAASGGLSVADAALAAAQVAAPDGTRARVRVSDDGKALELVLDGRRTEWEVQLSPDGRCWIRCLAGEDGEPRLEFCDLCLDVNGMRVGLKAAAISAGDGVPVNLVGKLDLADDETIRVPATLSSDGGDVPFGTLRVGSESIRGLGSLFIVGLETVK